MLPLSSAAAAVIHRQTKSHALIVAAAVDSLRDLVADTGAQTIFSADDREPNVLPHNLRSFLDDVLLQQPHQPIEFPLGSLPVLAAEAKQSQLLDAQTGAIFYDKPDALDTAAVSFDARQSTCLRPPTVSVHDDGNVLR